MGKESPINTISNSNTTTRLILLWAFSEAALGGLLHALRIPLTGLFVGGSAVIFISLIAHYSNNKTSILKATLLVTIIKFLVSPHTPLPAYFSLFVQGLLGFLLFNIFNIKRTAPILLGLFTLLFSSFQKIIIYTVLFGMTFWESIDIFITFILKQFSITSNLDISFSYIIVLAYIFMHIIGGIVAGVIAIRIPSWVDNFSHNIDYDKILSTKENREIEIKRKKKFWYQKPSGIIFILIAFGLIVLSYTTTAFDSSLPIKIIVMLARSIVITALWFFLIAPYALKLLQKVLNKKRTDYSNEIDNIVNQLPEMKATVKYSWEESNIKNGLGRVKLFLSYIFVIIIKDTYRVSKN